MKPKPQKPKPPALPAKMRAALLLLLIRDRAREPSTWSAAGVIAGGIAQAAGATPEQMAAVAAVVAAPGVFMSEGRSRGGR